MSFKGMYGRLCAPNSSTDCLLYSLEQLAVRQAEQAVSQDLQADRPRGEVRSQ